MVECIFYLRNLKENVWLEKERKPKYRKKTERENEGFKTNPGTKNKDQYEMKKTEGKKKKKPWTIKQIKNKK